MHHELMRSDLSEFMSRGLRQKSKVNLDTDGIKRNHQRGVATRSYLTESARLASSGLLIIDEKNKNGGTAIGSFDSRGSSHKDRYTSPRTQQALKDYLAHRNLTQRRNNVAPGGEVGFVCNSIFDAASRVTELIGPSPKDKRDYTYVRLGEPYRTMREQGLGPPCHGFKIKSTMSDHQGSGLMIREWRLDYDPKKGYHFNVNVCPPFLGGHGYEQRICPAGDPNALDLALIFEIPDRLNGGFEWLLGKVNDNLLADMEGSEFDNTSYLATILSR